MTTDQILFNALHAAADVAEAMHGKDIGDQYRKFAEKKYAEKPNDLMCQTCRGKGEYPGLDITCRACHGSGLEPPIDEAVLERAMAETVHLDDVMQGI